MKGNDELTENDNEVEWIEKRNNKLDLEYLQ